MLCFADGCTSQPALPRGQKNDMRLSDSKYLPISFALLSVVIALLAAVMVVQQRSDRSITATERLAAEEIRDQSSRILAQALAATVAAGDRRGAEQLLQTSETPGAYVIDAAGLTQFERQPSTTAVIRKDVLLENGWAVRLFQERRPPEPAERSSLVPIALMFLAVLLSIGAIALLRYTTAMRKPLQDLAKRAQRIAQGDFTSKSDDPIDSEMLGALPLEFERMREQLLATTTTRDFLEAMFNNMREIVIVTQANGKIQRLNQAAVQLLEHSEAELADRDFTTIVSLDARRRTDFTEPQSTAKETVLVSKSGKRVPVSFTSSQLLDDDGNESGRVFVAQDVSERKKAEQRIRYLARVDPLTKLPNRMQFQHLLQQGIARARRSRRYLALMYIDVDHFKDINDTLGHAAGDACLETFAERINDHLPAGAIAGRLAGDEFALLLTGFVQMDGLVQQVADTTRELLNTIGEPFSVQGQEIFVTASIGIALHPIDADNVIDLIRNADAALYQAKKSGGNCFEFYSPDMNAAVVERLMLKSRLRRAFEKDELRLHYQPKYNLTTGNIEGAEALVRWSLPDRGLMFPNDFIPLAEETNLILQIGEWVLDRVCADYRRWQRSIPSPGRVSMNLSLKQLRQRNFLEMVNGIFRKHQVSPTCLEFEITETTLMEDAERTIRILDTLYGMGLHLSIDDFGTGYSSLSALQQFPINTLKIDQSFVRDLPLDEDDSTIVATIINMGRNLNMDVVAEGVESEVQLEFLRKHGCTYVQGHLFGDPVTSDAYLELLLTQADGGNRFQKLFA